MYSASQRVEFFQSESSFESQSSLSNSRYYDFTNEIISQTENIFLGLRRQLTPNEQLSQEKIKHPLSRAQLIFKDTIPQHLAYLNKISAPGNATSQIAACQDRLKKLLADYERLKTGTMIYKQFFNLYGKDSQSQPDFSKGGQKVHHVDDSSEAVLKPQCIQISYNSDRAKLRATPRMLMTVNPSSSDKELTTLREEVYLLKRNIEDMKKKHDMELTNERLTTEKRIRTYLKVMAGGDGQGSNKREELQNYSFKLSCAEEESRGLKAKAEEQERVVEGLRRELASLKEEVEMLRKNDINLQEENLHDKSYTSEVGQKDDKRIQKKLKLMMQENQLLKNQLKAERQRIYRLVSNLTDQERRELQRLKKQIQKKNADVEQLYADLDKQRIEILQLTHNNSIIAKIQNSLKDENEELKKQLKALSKQQKAANLYPLPPAGEMQQTMSMSRKLQVLDYEGQGIEGLPYYDILSKQFKIRFRRACLKEKELLHKSNGLQVGVVTEFQKPDKINVLIHLMNYGDDTFKKVKGRLMNANENKITGQKFQFATIPGNDQVKTMVSLLIHHYPLGPLILLLEYQTEKREEVRILLPAHIFKMMEFEERNQPIKQFKKISIKTQRKIAKGIQQIAQYFKGAKAEKGAIKTSAFHRHTHTSIHLDIIETKDGIDLLYQHYQGNNSVTEYFIKTLQFLLQK